MQGQEPAITLSPQTLLTANKELLETELDGEVVLMSMELGNCYGLDGIGSEIWNHLKQPVALSEIKAFCRERYQGDPEQIDNDVERLLQQLLREKLIATCP